MGRTVVRRIDQPRTRNARDWMLLVGGAIILAFALIGVISAGAFVGSKFAGTPTKHHHTSQGSTSSTSAALEDVARAQTQATAIVRAAQDAGQAIVTRSQKRANRQAQHILAAARKRSATTAAASGVSSAAGSTQAPQPSSSTPTGATSGTSSTTSATSTGSTTQTGATSAGLAGASGTSGTTTPVQSTTPNLSGLPASWLVVAYNATFGSGPGSAGSISVINRSGRSFSGVARVSYIGPSGVIGSASAPFSNLAPGQSEVLPLNGSAYPSGATSYRIQVVDVH